MKPKKINALISISGLILFFIIVMCLHFLRPDKNMLSCFVSEYAVGNYSWLMTIAFYALSLASTLLLFGLSLQVTSSLICKITLGFFSIGILMAGVFPTDVPGFPQTTAGLIHGFAALIALLSLAISMIVWGISFKNNHEFKKFARPSVLWGLTSLILLIIFIGSPIGLRGLTQRLLLVCDISWLLLISMKLYRIN
ncbi:MAG: hypothetical protein CFE25_17065 [Chitinophagaceae bacterium BSSC1]|nr:MAG: hypothetical protein CFE25_17065 [Chitinophagaceae bacterium BSSC1]